MDLLPINPDYVPLLQGVRPFLGFKGQNLADLTLNFIDLIRTQPGQQTLQILSSTMGPKNQSVDGSPGASPIEYAFLLFLILILLILSSSVLVPGKTSVEEAVDAPAVEALPEEPIGILA